MADNLSKPRRTIHTNLLSGELMYLIQIFCAKHSHQAIQKRLIQTVQTSLLVLACLGMLAGCRCQDPETKYKSHMEQALKYKEEGKYKGARIELLNALEAKPKDGEGYFQLAEVQLRLEKVRQAIESYNTAINYSPNHRLARLHLASILLAAKQYELAENHITKLLEADPKDIEGLILKANLEVSGPRKNLEVARSILTDVLDRAPENISAIASLAHVELTDGNVKKAEELFTKAVEIDPENTTLRMALADLYSRQGRLDEAQSALQDLVEKNPDQSSLRYVFGEFLLRRGLGDKALEQYVHTVNSEPLRHDARDRLYDMYLTRGKLDEAKKLTTTLEKQYPNDPGTKYFQGRNAQLEGKDEEALGLFLESIELLNNFAPAFRRAGLMELKLGKYRPGIEHLNQAIAIDPGDVAARLALAKNLFARRDFAQATEHLNQVLSRYPRQLGANILRADIALIEGDTDKARKVYEFLVQAFPKHPTGYFKLGLLEEKTGNYDKAIELYRKTLSFDRQIQSPAKRLITLLFKTKKADPESVISEITALQEKSKNQKAEYHLILGTLVLTQKDNEQRFDDAKSHFQKALEGNPNLIGAYYALGAIDSVSGDLDGAAANYENLLKKNPKHVPTRMLLALTMERQGNYPQAAEEYRRILKTVPKFGPAANNLAWLLVEELNGDLDEALKLAEVAKEALPQESSVADTLGWVYFRRGSAATALAYIQEALEYLESGGAKKQPNPEIYYHLAAVQQALNNKQEAKQAIDKALSLVNESHPKYGKMKSLRDSLNK